MATKKFSPLLFLMSLGAGGIAIAPFSFFQYIVDHPKGLIQLSHLMHGELSIATEIFYRSLEAVMVVFTIIHLVLTFILIRRLITYYKSPDYKNLIENPLNNAAILTPFISLFMTLNVFIGSVRFFWPWMANNLQSLMLPSLIVAGIMWVLLLKTDIKLLKKSFEKGFDIENINFGWLLHPFALAMATVTLTGFAALATNPMVAHSAAFMASISGTMGFFLLVVKTIALFKSHFAATGMPERQFFPSFLIVIPNITLYAISAFRMLHYLETQFPDVHLHGLATILVTSFFAFETWYMLFGLALLKDYFKKHFFNKEFYVTQWGLVCPLVAYSVLAAFTFSAFVPLLLFPILSIIALITMVVLFFLLFRRQLSCSGIIKNKKYKCL